METNQQLPQIESVELALLPTHLLMMIVVAGHAALHH